MRKLDEIFCNGCLANFPILGWVGNTVIVSQFSCNEHCTKWVCSHFLYVILVSYTKVFGELLSFLLTTLSSEHDLSMHFMYCHYKCYNATKLVGILATTSTWKCKNYKLAVNNLNNTFGKIAMYLCSLLHWSFSGNVYYNLK